MIIACAFGAMKTAIPFGLFIICSPIFQKYKQKLFYASSLTLCLTHHQLKTQESHEWLANQSHIFLCLFLTANNAPICTSLLLKI